jgi:hypothetical protein
MSAPVAAPTGGAFTFNPNISVLAGHQYVAYISTYGDGQSDPNGYATMPTSTDAVPGVDYFVWNNSGNPNGNPSWDYFFDLKGYGYGDAQFTATFGGVPEPAEWALMLAGFAFVGATLRSRRQVAVAA